MAGELTLALIFGLIWLFVGVGLYIMTAFGLNDVLPDRVANKYAKLNWWAAMKARGRTLVTLIGNQVAIKSSDRDPYYHTEVIEVGDEIKHVPDPDRRMTPGYRERLGLAILQPAAMVVDQRMGRLGDIVSEDVAKDRDVIMAQTEDGESTRLWEAFIEVPKQAAGVDLGAAAALVKGVADGRAVRKHEEYVRHAMFEQQDRGMIPDGWQTTMIFLGAFMVVFFTINVLGGNSGGLGGFI
jgi:hypothetical protein